VSRITGNRINAAYRSAVRLKHSLVNVAMPHAQVRVNDGDMLEKYHMKNNRRCGRMESNITKSEMRLSRTSDVGLAHAAVHPHQAEAVTCPTNVKPRVTPEQRKTPVGKTPVGMITLDWPQSISK
jgi:hypothetical protein